MLGGLAERAQQVGVLRPDAPHQVHLAVRAGDHVVAREHAALGHIVAGASRGRNLRVVG